jgi:D-alanyl-D-alanine carboxypeptidase
MPASKLGLKVGQTIKVRAALYAAAVKSSNDAAVVLSEAIAGTEWGFSKLMNIQAKRLGLKRTAFRNATGLTAKGHYSTVKDMSLLARRLWRDFPEYYSVFSTESIVWKRKKYRSTNALLRTYKGADGIKTGYTRASGYNLAASAKRGKQRLLVIVFGGKSSRSRNKQVKNLLDKGFKKLDWQLSHLKRASATSAILNDPKIKIISLEKNLAEAKKETGNQKNVSAAVAKAIADIGLNASTLEAPLEIQTASIPDFSKKKEYFFGKSWGVQLGAFGSRNRALGRIQEAIALPVSDIESAYHTLDEVQVGEKIAYRARFTGMQENEARGACRELKQRRLDCVVIPPHGW